MKHVDDLLLNSLTKENNNCILSQILHDFLLMIYLMTHHVIIIYIYICKYIKHMNYINHLLSNTMINHNLPTGGLWRTIPHSFIIQPRAYVQSYNRTCLFIA